MTDEHGEERDGEREDADPAPLPRVPIGVPGLDAILCGGLPAVGAYLVKGRPGSGKTTLGLHFLREGVRRGERTLMLSFGQPRRLLERTAASFGWSLDGIEVHAPTTEEVAEDLLPSQTVLRSDSVELPNLTAAIRERLDATNATRVVFDSLSLVQVLATRPGRYRRELLELTELFHERDATALFTAVDVDNLDNGEAEAFLDGVLAMRRVPLQFGTQRFEVRVEKIRGSDFLGGQHDFEIGSDGIAVHPRWKPGRTPTGGLGERLASGRSEIDTMLGGGPRGGTSTLLMGPSGTGKTTLMALYAHAAAERGERSALFLFDQPKDAFLEQTRALGMDLAPHVEAERVALHRITSGSFLVGEFTGLVRGAAEAGVDLIGIDSLSTYFHATRDPALLRTQLTTLLNWLRSERVVTLMTLVQPGVFGQGRAAPQEISELADTVVLLRYFEAQGALRRALSVVKKRYGAHEKTIRELRIGRDGVAVGAATREFSGVLTGTPEFLGAPAASGGHAPRGDEAED